MSKPSGKICYQQLVTGSSYTSLFMSQIATEAITLRVRGCLDYILPCGDVLYCFSFTEETPAALAAHPVSSAYPGHSRTACLIFFFGCGKHGIQGDYHDHGLYPCFTFTKKTLLISFMNGSIALEQKLVLQNEHHSIFHPCLRQAVKSADSDPAGTNIFSQDSSFQRRKEAPDLE